jgi:hypothetical protein
VDRSWVCKGRRVLDTDLEAVFSPVEDRDARPENHAEATLLYAFDIPESQTPSRLNVEPVCRLRNPPTPTLAPARPIEDSSRNEAA